MFNENQLFANSRWLTEGDSKEDGGEGTCQNQNIDCAFHVRILVHANLLNSVSVKRALPTKLGTKNPSLV